MQWSPILQPSGYKIIPKGGEDTEEEVQVEEAVVIMDVEAEEFHRELCANFKMRIIVGRMGTTCMKIILVQPATGREKAIKRQQQRQTK